MLLRSERGREGVSGSEMERVVSSGSEMERVLRSEREGDQKSEREEESQSILGEYLGDFVFNDFFFS